MDIFTPSNLLNTQGNDFLSHMINDYLFNLLSPHEMRHYKTRKATLNTKLRSPRLNAWHFISLHVMCQYLSCSYPHLMLNIWCVACQYRKAS